MKVVVVGLGLIGGSLSLDLRELGFASVLIGVDASAQNAQEALELGLVDRIEALETAIPNADLVILAVPVVAITRILPVVLSLVPAHAAVTDMGSTKQTICQMVQAHPSRARFVATHPMAGTENSGPRAALRGLFSGKTAVICDADQSAAEALKRVEEMYRLLKMRVIRMSAAEHDLHAAYVSHLSHISSFVLANTVLAKEQNVTTIFDLAGGGFESTVRLAKSSPDMWAPIFEQNRQNVIDALDSYIGHLQAFRKTLVERADGETRKLMEDANRIRRVLEDLGERRTQGSKKDGIR